MIKSNRELPCAGDVFLHFKGKYYVVLMLAHHSETGETLVIYRAMYGTRRVCARPVEMFLSEVDREKYPDVTQEFRFEYVGSVGEIV